MREVPAGVGPGAGRQAGRLRPLLAKIGQRQVPASPNTVAMLGGDYGLTWPEGLTMTLEIKQRNEQWVPTVKDLEGQYSIQVQLLGHQADVPDATVANAGNYNAIIAALRAYGVPGGAHNFYSLRAVQQHEARHASRALQALMDTKERIAQDVEATAIPVAAANDAGAAEIAIRAQAAFTDITDPDGAGNAFEAWLLRMADLLADDHDPGGACEDAEASIVNPIIAEIEELATTNRWRPQNPQVPMPLGYVRPVWPPPGH